MDNAVSYSNPPLSKYVEMLLQLVLYQLNAYGRPDFYMAHIFDFCILNSLL